MARFVQLFFSQLMSMNVKETKPDGRKRVLVVDADQDFRRYLTDCIEAEGISCITATSVSEALEALGRNNVSVVLVDWFLDRVANEVVRKARSISAVMPIIVMSGKSYNVKMDALLADADEFLEKSVGGNAGRADAADRSNATGGDELPRRDGAAGTGWRTASGTAGAGAEKRSKFVHGAAGGTGGAAVAAGSG